jgi:UMF1 family MFS transporter
LVATFPFLRDASAERSSGYRIAFAITAVIFLLSALPSLVWLPRGDVNTSPATTAIWKQLATTIKNWRKHEGFARLLVAFYFVMDAKMTLIYFTAIYATTSLKLTVVQMMWLLLGTQLIAIPSTIGGSFISARFGAKKVFLSCLVGWAFNIAALALAANIGALLVVMVLTGLVIGTIQAVGRSWLTELAEREKISELFGFSAIATRVSTVLGPALFGLVSYVSGSQRAAIWSLMLFLIAGFFITLTVPDVAGRASRVRVRV